MTKFYLYPVIAFLYFSIAILYFSNLVDNKASRSIVTPLPKQRTNFSSGDVIDQTVFSSRLSEELSSEKVVSGIPILGSSKTSVGKDSDFDGLSDSDEILLGTNPNNPDTDGDALKDGWEVIGVNGINLRRLGASPLKKDIFVEMDYMVRKSAKNALGPSKSVIRLLEQIFAAAPVTNPDGSLGIGLHLLIGNRIKLDTLLHPYQQEFFKLKVNNFDPNRECFCHYMIWGDSYLNEDGDSNSSGNAFTHLESDFIVTLGKWEEGNGGTDNQKVGTFIHELGHNLGLRHGGLDDIPRKPNHISAMNWNHQEYGIEMIDPVRRDTLLFTYQWFDLPSLNEGSLLEEHGLGSVSNLEGLITKYYSPTTDDYLPYQAFGSIDWNFDAKISVEPLAADLNGDSKIEYLASTVNEWQLLNFGAGVIGRTFQPKRNKNKFTFPKVSPIKELTETASKKSRIR